MRRQPKKTLSAQVILRGARGQAPGPDTAVTTESLPEYLPTSRTIDQVRASLAKLGFELDATVGNSFAISGSVRTFEDAFETKVQYSQEDGAHFKLSDGPSRELTSNQLPKALRHDVVAVTFGSPPDFGPSEFSM